MTVRARTPNTAAHTKAMLESILRPHSLEELHALVGSFPFKAVKVVDASTRLNLDVRLHVGAVVSIEGPYDSHDFETDVYSPKGRQCKVDKTIKQWRLADSED